MINSIKKNSNENSVATKFVVLEILNKMSTYTLRYDVMGISNKLSKIKHHFNLTMGKKEDMSCIKINK